MADVDTRALMEALRTRLERDQAEGRLEGIRVVDLAEAMAHPKAGAAIADAMAREASSVKPGEPAPDFTLPWLPGAGDGRSEALSLSDHLGRRPVALIFGSYT